MIGYHLSLTSLWPSAHLCAAEELGWWFFPTLFATTGALCHSVAGSIFPHSRTSLHFKLALEIPCSLRNCYWFRTCCTTLSDIRQSIHSSTHKDPSSLARTEQPQYTLKSNGNIMTAHLATPRLAVYTAHLQEHWLDSQESGGHHTYCMGGS